MAEKNCFDPSSAALFAEVPKGLVLAPLFYGSTVLMLSGHDVVAGPYHRNGKAILDTIYAMRGRRPRQRRSSMRAASTTSRSAPSSLESAIAAGTAPDGLLADLLDGQDASLAAAGRRRRRATALRFWRVVRYAAP